MPPGMGQIPETELFINEKIIIFARAAGRKKE
jgi:hypothetical protein